MLFSVIVPVYNVEKYIEQCIESILNQSFQDFELILIDDGSTDNSGVICDRYVEQNPDRIRILHKKNQGLLLARRDGIKLAQGEYIIHCDSDDFLDKGMFESFNKVIESSHPDIIQYDLFLYRGDDDIINVNFGSLPIEAGKVYDIDILRNWVINREYIIWSMAGKCVKRTCYDIQKDYSLFSRIKYGEDTLQSLEIYDKAVNFVYLPDCFYFYRAQSGMTSSLPTKYIDDFFALRDEMYRLALKWNIGYEKEKVAYYICYEVYFFLLNIRDNRYPVSKTKELLKYVLDKEIFHQSYRDLVGSDYYKNNVRWKMKILLGLLEHRMMWLLTRLLRLKKR